MILPGWGTAIGAVVGAAAGAIGGYATDQRRKRQMAAQHQYEEHLRTYLAQNEIAQRELGQGEFNIAQGQIADLGNFGQSFAALPQQVKDGAAKTAANYAAIPGGAPVPQVQSGWDTGAQGKDVNRMKQASDAFLAPQTQAYQFHGGQIQAGLQQQQAQNRYQLGQAMRGQDLRQLQELYAMQQGDRDLAFQRQYGADAVNAYHAANAGSEQMLYGQLLQSGAQIGAGMYGMNRNRPAQSVAT